MNGSLVATYEGDAPNPPDGDFTIGRQFGDNGQHWYGTIDEVRVFDVALSQSDIQSTLYTELSGDEEGLVGYWDFNEGTGDVLYDQSGNENHGTIYGATWSDDFPEQVVLNSLTLVGQDGATLYAISDVAETWDGFHDQVNALQALYNYYNIDADVQMATIHSQE